MRQARSAGCGGLPRVVRAFVTDLAVLAPVPYEHLESGEDVCRREGKVAFGSMKWEFFRDLDARATGEKVPVYLYASWAAEGSARPLVSWRATYVGHVEGSGAGHPEGMRYRPPTTGKYPTDNSEWAVYWEVEELERLPSGSGIAMNRFVGYDTGKPFARHLVPEGPMLVREPPPSPGDRQ